VGLLFIVTIHIDEHFLEQKVPFGRLIHSVTTTALLSQGTHALILIITPLHLHVRMHAYILLTSTYANVHMHVHMRDYMLRTPTYMHVHVLD
jgi:hypothetical protein